MSARHIAVTDQLAGLALKFWRTIRVTRSIAPSDRVELAWEAFHTFETPTEKERREAVELLEVDGDLAAGILVELWHHLAKAACEVSRQRLHELLSAADQCPDTVREHFVNGLPCADAAACHAVVALVELAAGRIEGLVSDEALAEWQRRIDERDERQRREYEERRAQQRGEVSP